MIIYGHIYLYMVIYGYITTSWNDDLLRECWDYYYFVEGLSGTGNAGDPTETSEKSNRWLVVEQTP